MLLCSDLKEINKKITLLDIGSGFDPIFSEKTRPKQPSAEKCFEYYKKILPSNYKFKKSSHAINSLNKIPTFKSLNNLQAEILLT